MLVTTTGSKLWRFSYRFDGKQKLLAPGQYPVTSLADAILTFNESHGQSPRFRSIWIFGAYTVSA